MKDGFCFIDKVTEVKKNEELTAFFTLQGDEEFLLDHFGDFAVMPGVLILESLKQASTRLLQESFGAENNYRLRECEGIKFGQFVKPGSQLKIQTRLIGSENGLYKMSGKIELGPQKALQADLVLEKI